MADSEEVCVLIPTLNEEETIGSLLDAFREEGFDNVLVIDGGSTDRTREIASDRGVRVCRQSDRGKGQAVREALGMIDVPYVLMLDGDGTYSVADAHAMLQPLFDGRADHVVGDRFANMDAEAMTTLNRFGNKVINATFRAIHGEDFGDILSGYRAFTTSSLDRFLLTAEGFGIETEMAVECAKHDVRTVVVPIRYRSRPDGSETNLRPFRDGAGIVMTIYRLAKTNNPLFYFGSLGIASVFAGLGLGSYIGIEWITRGVSHEILAIVSAFTILFGVQLVIFGVLSDMIIGLHREQLRQLE